MRFVTNMVSKGKCDYNLPARNLLQKMYYEFILIPPTVHRELKKKINQHKGSMLKVSFIPETRLNVIQSLRSPKSEEPI